MPRDDGDGTMDDDEHPPSPSSASPPPLSPSPTPTDSAAAAAAANKTVLQARLSKKRTKTGCLTCRKRRIKCDEERPVCRNCIKSRRHCDGYHPRVVFRPPTFDFRPAPLGGGAHITFSTGLTPPSRPDDWPHGAPVTFDVLPHPPPPPPPPPPFTAPHAVGTGGAGVHYAGPPPPPPYQYAVNVWPPWVAAGPSPPPPPAPPPVFLSPSAPPPTVYSPQPPRTVRMPGPDPRVHGVDAWRADAAGAPPAYPLDPGGGHASAAAVAVTTHPDPPPSSSRPEHSAPPFDAYGPVLEPGRPPIGSEAASLGAGPWVSSHAPVSLGRPPPPPPPQTPVLSCPEFLEHCVPAPWPISPNQFLRDAAVEKQDDDYDDVRSDDDHDDDRDEADVDTTARAATDYSRQQALRRILHGDRLLTAERPARRYDTFIDDGLLDVYSVEEHSNPLRNPATARVFAHFIAVTGPGLSIFERHPRNTSVLFTQGYVPFSRQGLWTYTMPMAALHHQGLLHTMLALASLHIARLTGASVTPSIQHYSWALKHVHRCVAHPTKRQKLTTIAASMLLGFYEVMAADHLKWNMHLAGSRQLFVEIDFVGMAQQFRQLKMERAAGCHHLDRVHAAPPHECSPGELLDQIPDVDDQVISDLVGRDVRYGAPCGEIMTPQSSVPPELDLSTFEMLRDLYWWYCKQDVYQSLVGGNALLRWPNCPPRAPLGKLDAVYGSFDHLILLLARIADFSSRDRARKLKQIELNGGQWRPPPGMRMPKPPAPAHAPPQCAYGTAAMPGPGSGPSPAGCAMPPFYGLAPCQNRPMPSSYGPMNDLPEPPHHRAQDSCDLQAATQAAIEEYGRLRAALHQFATSLGPAFQPLTSEYQPEMATPFGPARFYRSYDIGCLWAVYNMAIIVAIRSHPHMAPAAHVAAGIAAEETGHYAHEIGRITAGIAPGPPDQPLNPSLGAALCESCMPSFFAAIQYQDPHQRHATVTRIANIAQRTGWGSVELIANGIETAWIKAAAAGRGPPYQRIARPPHSDDARLNGSWEHADMDAMPADGNDADRRFVRSSPSARLHWAIGIIGTEEDEGLTRQ